MKIFSQYIGFDYTAVLYDHHPLTGLGCISDLVTIHVKKIPKSFVEGFGVTPHPLWPSQASLVKHQGVLAITLFFENFNVCTLLPAEQLVELFVVVPSSQLLLYICNH